MRKGSRSTAGHGWRCEAGGTDPGGGRPDRPCPDTRNAREPCSRRQSSAPCSDGAAPMQRGERSPAGRFDAVSGSRHVRRATTATPTDGGPRSSVSVITLGDHRASGIGWPPALRRAARRQRSERRRRIDPMAGSLGTKRPAPTWSQTPSERVDVHGESSARSAGASLPFAPSSASGRETRRGPRSDQNSRICFRILPIACSWS